MAKHACKFCDKNYETNQLLNLGRCPQCKRFVSAYSKEALSTDQEVHEQFMNKILKKLKE